MVYARRQARAQVPGAQLEIGEQPEPVSAGQLGVDHEDWGGM
jgi:hypothetical protein